jgi:hypothetical protein
VTDDDLDLPNDCWTAPIGDIEIGDVCEALPLSVLCDDRLGEVLTLDDPPTSVFVPARHSYGLVIGVMRRYAVVAAIGTLRGVGDEEMFQELVESGRTAPTLVRLPPIPEDRFDDWQGRDGVAMLSHVETFLIDYELARRRVAAMNDAARELIRRRVAKLIEV